MKTYFTIFLVLLVVDTATAQNVEFRVITPSDFDTLSLPALEREYFYATRVSERPFTNAQDQFDKQKNAIIPVVVEWSNKLDSTKAKRGEIKFVFEASTWIMDRSPTSIYLVPCYAIVGNKHYDKNRWPPRPRLEIINSPR